MTNPPEMTPTQIALMDTAFKTGIAEAMNRNSCLLLIRSWVGVRDAWFCAYPPVSETAATVLTWARAADINAAESDLFIPRSKVEEAATDLEIVS